MKLRMALLSTVALVTLLLAYVVGFYAGKGKMDTFCGYVIQGSAAGHHVSLFAKHMAAIDALRAGKPNEAENILRFLARIDASLIIECKKDTMCAQLMGNPPPEDSKLRKAASN
jgi:hypothetical protein